MDDSRTEGMQLDDNRTTVSEGKKNRKAQIIIAIIGGAAVLIAAIIGTAAITANIVQKQFQSQNQYVDVRLNPKDGEVDAITRTEAVQNAVASQSPTTTQPQFIWLEEITPMAFYRMYTDYSSEGEYWKWEQKDFDNMGEIHEHGIYFAPNGYGSEMYVKLELPVTKFSRFTGTIVLTQKSKNLTKPAYIDVFVGDEKVDTIENFCSGFVPREFSYDVSGADKITFSMETKSDRLEPKGFGLVNAKLFY